jgi:eukaryotic-like serine/threonine-protein kinase
MRDTTPARVRLADFEVDLRAGEVWAGGQAVRLQEKPLRVLQLLVESAGELVGREEIQRKLWPNDTIVDFEHGINTAIKLLRRVLNDSADRPRYIETIPRRGYRLLVPVEKLSVVSDQLSEAEVAAGLPAELQPSVLTGRTVSHYRVLDIIGGGGMGVVYRAEDLKLGRQVALKFLPEELGSDAQALERFSREARAASSLDHPNICPIHEFGEHEGRPFMVMQLLEGQTLRDRLAADEPPKPLPLEELLDIGIQVSEGLQAAHDKGIIHRDIKPANIFLTNKGVVKILDFGLAKLLVEAPTVEAPDFSPANKGEREIGLQPRLEQSVEAESGLKPDSYEEPERRAEARLFHLPATPPDSALTRTGVAMGTAGYMSPEQVRGDKLDARTDIFSFGLVLYEMATGQRAFSGKTAEVVHDAILHTVPVPARELNTALPVKLVTTIDKALEKDRYRRYQTVAEMRDALERVEEQGKSSRPQFTHHRWKWFAAAVCVVALAAGGALYWRSRAFPRLRAGDTVVVAEFQNNTSDPAFNDALKLALETELSQTPFLDVLAPDKVRSTLKIMNHPGSEPLSPALAQQVCLHTNSAAVVLGSIADEGNNYRIGLTAVNCKTHSTLASAVANAKIRSVVVRTLGNLGAEFRAKLGEPRKSLQQFNRPLDEATSSSIEALQAFGQGEKAGMEEGPVASMPFYKRASGLDPNFALAWTYLGIMYGNTGDDRLQLQCMSRAYELRNRVSRRDQFVVEASYYSMVEGSAEKAIPVYKQWLENYPRDRIALTNLGNLESLIGENTEAARLFREAIRLDPDDISNYGSLIMAAELMDRFDEAVATYEEAKAHRIEIDNLAWNRLVIAFLQHDSATMEQISHAHPTNPFSRNRLLGARARIEQYYGRFRRGREFWAQSTEDSQHQEFPWKTWSLSVQALTEAVAGNSNLALPLARQALAESHSRTDRGRATVTLALAGDDDLAENEARALAQEYPVDTILQNFWLPTTRAVLALHREHPDIAIQELQRASHYERFGSLLPAYVRGEAYLKLDQPAQAVLQFQNVLAHPGWTNAWAYRTMAYQQLGRAQAMMGDKAAARKSYQEFLTLWKDADPDIPIYKQAKAEYAKLK